MMTVVTTGPSTTVWYDVGLKPSPDGRMQTATRMWSAAGIILEPGPPGRTA